MGFFSWFSNKPPEPLVLGAKLRCPYGSHDGYLFVNSTDINVNNLPKACVEDCKALTNILPFGDCYGGGSCEGQMEFGDKWENPEPQSEKVNGKEIITTKSLLVCKKWGMQLKVVNSGQDGIFARQVILVRELDTKYPGLRAILENPYGSLYLEDGMYEKAISFLEDQMKQNGGEIQLFTMYDKDNVEGLYIKATLSRLLPACDLNTFEGFISGMETTSVKNDMYDLPNLDERILNKDMITLLKKDSKETSELVKNHSFYKWQEENKLFLSVLADGVTNLAYVALMYQSMNTENNTRSSQKEATVQGEGGSETSFRDLMSPEEVARYDAYWNNVADDMLKSNVNNYRQSILNGSITKTTGGKINSKVVTAAIDTNTGDMYYGISGMNNNPTRGPMNTQMQSILDKVSASQTNYPLDNCGEFNAINNALNNGADLNSLRVYSIDRVGGAYKPPCINCQNLYESLLHFTQ